MFCLLSPESFVPQDHPLRAIKPFVDEALRGLSPLFDEMYAENGRPSIPPERLLKAKLLQAFYSIRSEALLVEMLHYNLLFRWFLDLNLTDEIWDNSTFTVNQFRLLDHDTARLFFHTVAAQGLDEQHPLHGGRHAGPSLGQPEKFCAQGGAGPKDGRRPRQSQRGLQR
jgi:transposase